METKEYRTRDKSEFGRGPWQDEPDKKQWQDPETGYPCLIVRNEMGTLCGYVGVPPTHPYHKVHYDLVDEHISVHGGLTYSGSCQEGSEDESICHVCAADEPEPWWLGFDCAHFMDYVPTMVMLSKLIPGHEGNPYEKPAKEVDLDDINDEFCNKSYRDFAYVSDQVEDLARQLKEVSKAAQEANKR